MWLIATAVLIGTPPEEYEYLPEWMAGCWDQASGSGWTEECWTKPRGRMMMGSSRSGDGQKLNTFEFMRITSEPAGVTFCALPQGQAGDCFDKTEQSGAAVTFVNENHDYPQRIRYWRDGKDLVAEIAMKDGSKAVSWRYKPMGSD